MSSAAAYDTTEREERAPSFVAGAWLNRKWTRSSSSILLGLIPTALLVLSGGQLPVIGPALVDAGVLTPESAPVVAGVTAAIVGLALETLGRPQRALYDGSWSEWGADPARPVATGPA